MCSKFQELLLRLHKNQPPPGMGFLIGLNSRERLPFHNFLFRKTVINPSEDYNIEFLKL